MQDGVVIRCEELELRMGRLERQLELCQTQLARLEDERDIIRLQSAYGYYMDKARWDDAADLFAADGELEVSQRGVYLGRERIRRYLHKLGELEFGTLFNHLQLQPVITVAPDRLSAEGRWRALIQTAHLNHVAVEGEGVYENRYVREQGIWKIASLHFFTTYYFERAAGWEHRVIARVSEMADFPPDLPPTVDCGLYPRVFLPPFHYAHPVRDASPTRSGGAMGAGESYVEY